MFPDDRKRSTRKDFLLASAMVAAGLVISGVSVIELTTHSMQTAQATQPLQSSPPAASDNVPANVPAESKPGGERPTTPAPEPARPNAGSQTSGAAPALPSAPAEKMAPPIQQK
jgi:hypothetical protein